jgi:hypothetical protein
LVISFVCGCKVTNKIKKTKAHADIFSREAKNMADGFVVWVEIRNFATEL